jgi:hypothetical protein
MAHYGPLPTWLLQQRGIPLPTKEQQGKYLCLQKTNVLLLLSDPDCRSSLFRVAQQAQLHT